MFLTLSNYSFSRHGFLDQDTGERKLYWLASYDQLFGCFDFKRMQDIINSCSYCHIKLDRQTNPYLFVEKDGGVKFTSKPLCFFDSKLLSDYHYTDLKNAIMEAAKSSGVSYEIVKSFELAKL